MSIVEVIVEGVESNALRCIANAFLISCPYANVH